MTNISAEFNLLAGLCKYPDLFFDVMEFLSTEDFTQKSHRQFFIVFQRLILSFDSHEIIVVTEGNILAKAAELNLTDFYDLCDNGELIRACIQHSSNKADVISAFKQVKKETVKRTLKSEAEDIISYLDETSDDISTIISRVEDRLITANNKLQGTTESPVINLAKKAIDIVKKLAEHPGQLGLDIGMPVWQRAIGGIRNGSVTFIASTTKCGKSQLGVRAALEIAKLGLPTLLCDSELNETLQSVRAFGQYAEIDYEVLETGYWKEDPIVVKSHGYDETFITKCKIAKTSLYDSNIDRIFQNLPLYYYSINGMSARDIIPFLRRWILQHIGVSDSQVPKCLIIFDYIKLTHILELKTIGAAAHDILAADCSALHDFAEKYNLPIIAFGQTNRQIDEDLNCIAGAKKISEILSSSTLFKKKSPEELLIDPNGSHLMRIFATRYGKGISGDINLNVDLSIGKFIELGVSKPRTLTVSGNSTDGEND